jgi:hypothetical protein
MPESKVKLVSKKNSFTVSEEISQGIKTYSVRMVKHNISTHKICHKKSEVANLREEWKKDKLCTTPFVRNNLDFLEEKKDKVVRGVAEKSLRKRRTYTEKYLSASSSYYCDNETLTLYDKETQKQSPILYRGEKVMEIYLPRFYFCKKKPQVRKLHGMFGTRFAKCKSINKIYKEMHEGQLIEIRMRGWLLAIVPRVYFRNRIPVIVYPTIHAQILSKEEVQKLWKINLERKIEKFALKKLFDREHVCEESLLGTVSSVRSKFVVKKVANVSTVRTVPSVAPVWELNVKAKMAIKNAFAKKQRQQDMMNGRIDAQMKRR